MYKHIKKEWKKSYNSYKFSKLTKILTSWFKTYFWYCYQKMALPIDDTWQFLSKYTLYKNILNYPNCTNAWLECIWLYTVCIYHFNFMKNIVYKHWNLTCIKTFSNVDSFSTKMIQNWNFLTSIAVCTMQKKVITINCRFFKNLFAGYFLADRIFHFIDKYTQRHLL